MKIEYDKTIDAKYITLKSGKVIKTESPKDWLNIDLADDGSVIGVEILDASEHKIGISSADGQLLSIFSVENNPETMSDIPKLEVSDEKLTYKECVAV